MKLSSNTGLIRALVALFVVAALFQGAVAADDQAHLIRSYGGVLLFDFLGADTAVVVEQPWLRVMDLFPPALYKHRFGT